VDEFRGAGSAEAGDDAEFAQAFLRMNGVRVRPSLTRADPGSQVQLQYGNRLAIEGAGALTAVLVIAGLVAYWAYGAVLLALGCVAVALLVFWWHRLDRSLPAWLPRGRLTGLAVAAPLLIVIGGVLCLIIRHNRTDDANMTQASALVRQADAALDQGDIGTAQQLLFRAEGLSHGKLPAFTEDVRAHLIVKQLEGLLAEQNRKEGIYDEAVRAAAAQRYAEAVKRLREIPGFRDADSLLREYQRNAR